MSCSAPHFQLSDFACRLQIMLELQIPLQQPHALQSGDSTDLSQHAGLITGKITASLRLSMDLFLKCKSSTSAEVALFCCNALGVEGVISFSWGAETAEKILLFFFFSFFHKPVSNLQYSKPTSSDYNSFHFMKLPQVSLAILKVELMEELNWLVYVRRLMLAGKNQDQLQSSLHLNCVSLCSALICSEQKSLASRLLHVPLTFPHANIPQDIKDKKLWISKNCRAEH